MIASGNQFIVNNQGPLRNTIADFWRMVWEHKLTAIIMLTETIEAGRVGVMIKKCVVENIIHFTLS